MTRVRRVEGNRRSALDGGWQCAPASAGVEREAIDSLDWTPAAVPNTAANALRAAGRWDFSQTRDFDAEDWWWRTRFSAEAGPAVLGFDGLATLAEAWLDGRLILETDNMFRAHEVPVTLNGEHELLIRCRALTPELARRRRPRPGWQVPMLEQQALRWFRTTLLGRTPGWSPPCPAVGPWRAVWLETRALRVGRVQLDARAADAALGSVTMTATLDARVDTATLIVERDGQRIVTPLTRHDDQWHARAEVPGPVLWWPHTHGEPALYQASLTLAHAGQTTAVDLGRIGFRNIELERGSGDDFSIKVNGVPVFCRGACWTPPDPVTLTATPDEYHTAIAQVREAGMNMLRVGGTMVYEDDAFYDALDEGGILLWQDLMFANMDYPDDEAFVANALAEVDQQLERLHSHACLAVLCGNSEIEQQAAMSGAPRECWSPPLFHQDIAERARTFDVPYVPSSATGGAFPHVADHGPTSYYGVGAYLRDFNDARLSRVRFASECLAFANIPEDSGLPKHGVRAHHPLWKQRSPRDLGAGWDFDDVRDHYVQRLFGVDAVALRSLDHDRYLALGRAATGEAMARCFAEWRRADSPTRGALIWFLRDLWPGAGWGVVDANGDPKPCWYALKRALAPVALAITDEGVNGLALHVCNDPDTPLDARVEIDLYRNGEVPVGHVQTGMHVPAHAAIALPAASLFDEWLDLSHAYRFGPPLADVIHAKLFAGDALLSDAFWFPAALPSTRDADIGLTVTIERDEHDAPTLRLATRRFAQSIAIDAPGFTPVDNGFHLAPGQVRDVLLHRKSTAPRTATRGNISALNAASGLGFTLP
jgi:beta-mannosidase